VWVLAGQRVQPGCAADAERFEAVRWPALLGPFLDAEQRHPLERLPWRADCAPREPVAHRLRVVGLEPGTVLRPTPGQREVTLRLQAIGAQQGVAWLLDGQLAGSSEAAGGVQTLTLRQPGTHALTALDGRGRWARVAFELQAPAHAAAP
jgi:penicillin-binding protein 1C